MTEIPPTPKRIAVIGGGPAGLMAAEVARAAGLAVDVYEAKGSVGRKFLIAGKGGLNLTHSEARPAFDARYRERAAHVGHWLDDLDGEGLREWVRGFGIDTYVGTSGRVFPLDRKAAPLLRSWVRRLRESGVAFHVHHRWLGWTKEGALRFETQDGERQVAAQAVVLAMGGGSWPELGSDGAWVATLSERDIDVAPLLPANCGFDIGWSPHLAQRHAGAPLRPVIAYWLDARGIEHSRQGEFVITATGIEGSLAYALSADLRDAIARDGEARLALDLVPGRELARLQRELCKPREGRSLGEHLRRQAGITGVKSALLHGFPVDVIARGQTAEGFTCQYQLPQHPHAQTRDRRSDIGDFATGREECRIAQTQHLGGKRRVLGQHVGDLRHADVRVTHQLTRSETEHLGQELERCRQVAVDED